MKARRLSIFLGAVLFAAAVWILVRQLGTLGPARVMAALRETSRSAVWTALTLVALNYIVLTFHDQLAVTYVGRRLPRWRVAIASFVGFAVSNTLGFGMLSGATARYRFYSRWSVNAAELSRIVAFYSATFAFGLLIVGGTSAAIAPPELLTDVFPDLLVRACGALLAAIPVAYVAVCRLRRRPIRIGRVHVAIPSTAMAIGQLTVSTIDWLLAASIVYVLLPDGHPPYIVVAGAFTAAQLVGLASHVPGGVAVFDGLLMLFLQSSMDPADILPALVLYRVLYYLVPLTVALLLLIGDEALQRRGWISAWRDGLGNIATLIVPRTLAAFTFMAGAVLLFSGVTPGVPARLAILSRIVPLPLLELSHFAASLAGLLLLFLAQAIASRVDAAFYLTCLTLAFGSVMSLLKGGDYEEALALAGVLVVLIAARRDFTRRARLFDRALSPGWAAAAASVVAASVWLGLFAHRNVAYSQNLWWQFAFTADAPRVLRAEVAVMVAFLVVGIRVLLRPTLPRPPRPSTVEYADVDRVIQCQTATTPYLAYLGDKTFLWNEARTAFVMYCAQGKSWVALGDVVGRADEARRLVRQFLEGAHAEGFIPVFYDVAAARLADYADYRLQTVKVGEEARVRLDTFTMNGALHRHLRATLHRLERDGATFRVLPAHDVPTVMEQLREVSDEWLTTKNVSEKGFSLGFFHPDYVSRFPVAVIERDSRVEAFASLWPGPDRGELAPDLMRYRESAPNGVMDALFAHTMLWGREQAYEWFNLGMAPLSALQPAPVGRAWSRFGRLVYRYAEGQSAFEGLRAYKEKFDPVWQPRYLVYPDNFSLPRVLADVTALIAGGYRRVIVRGSHRAA
jgi:phosphatidylglycerol lysyltransferase